MCDPEHMYDPMSPCDVCATGTSALLWVAHGLETAQG